MKSTKRNTLMTLAAAALSTAALINPRVNAQEEITQPPADKHLMYGVQPLPAEDTDMDAILGVSTPSTGLKLWTYNVTSERTGSKGDKYSGVMVGSSPYTTNGTTTTTVYVVPLKVEIGSHTFDPTVADKACYSNNVPESALKISPMVLSWYDFKLNGVNVGTTQYSDAFQRANFWKEVSAKGGTYHNLINYKFLPAMTYTPSSSDATIYSNPGGCTPYVGGLEYNSLDFVLKLFFIPSLASQGVKPNSMVAFMLYNTVMYNTTPGDCCYGGYHGAYNSISGTTGVQTYAVFDYDTADYFGTNLEDTAIMSHEINEWQDDPLGNNATPAWGHIGQVSGCQGNLEVGDPLTGTDIPPANFLGLPFHMQELAFFSWFYGGSSIGAGGKYSDNGTFRSAQGGCS